MQDVINEAKKDLVSIVGKNPASRYALLVVAAFLIGGFLPVAMMGNQLDIAGYFEILDYHGLMYLVLGVIAVAAAWGLHDKHITLLRKIFLYGGAAIFVYTLYEIHEVGMAVIRSELQSCNQILLVSNVEFFTQMLGVSNEQISTAVKICQESFGPGKTQHYFPGLGGILFLVGASLLIRAGSRLSVSGAGSPINEERRAS